MTRRVNFAETDLAGVMHFSNYLRWMEDIEHAFWRSLGLSVVIQDQSAKLSWPRVSVSCEYHGPVSFEDEVNLRFRITNVGSKSLQYEVEFSCRDRRVALGKTTAVCCVMEQGRFRSIAVPAAIRDKLQ
jgi:YbgC/YbaW family acyl-CoA thioester hydrolase